MCYKTGNFVTANTNKKEEERKEGREGRKKEGRKEGRKISLDRF